MLIGEGGRVQPIRLPNVVSLSLFQADGEIAPANEYLPGVFPPGKSFDEREQRRRRACELTRGLRGFHERDVFRAGKVAQHGFVIGNAGAAEILSKFLQ